MKTFSAGAAQNWNNYTNLLVLRKVPVILHSTVNHIANYNYETLGSSNKLLIRAICQYDIWPTPSGMNEYLFAIRSQVQVIA